MPDLLLSYIFYITVYFYYKILFTGCTDAPSLVSLKHLWELSWKQTFWKSTRKYSFDCSAPVESLGDRKQEQQEDTFPQGKRTYLMWHGAQPPKLTMKRRSGDDLPVITPLSRHLQTVGCSLGTSGGNRELKLQSFSFFMIFFSFFEINRSHTKKKQNKTKPEKHHF